MGVDGGTSGTSGVGMPTCVTCGCSGERPRSGYEILLDVVTPTCTHVVRSHTTRRAVCVLAHFGYVPESVWVHDDTAYITTALTTVTRKAPYIGHRVTYRTIALAVRPDGAMSGSVWMRVPGGERTYISGVSGKNAYDVVEYLHEVW